MVIVAGCSVLNIGNFNDWKAYKTTGSPGIAWRDKVRNDCILLGYGATAPGVNLGDGLYIDTRVLIRYREYLSGQQSAVPGEAQAMAWLLANAAMEHRQADNACAITQDYYYFIHFECLDLDYERIDDPHFIAEAGTVRYSQNRKIWRIHRSLWGYQGWAQLEAVKSGPLKKMMRELPTAAPGQSERI